MKFLECDLEEIIMKSNWEQLYERGLYLSDFKRNQVRIGNYGTADIITLEKGNYYNREDGRCVVLDKPTISVYELKKDKVSLSSFAQACNYAKGVQDYFISRGKTLSDYNWRIVLIGRDLDTDSSLCYFPNLFISNDDSSFSVKIYKYEYDLDGLKFTSVYNYSLIDKGF